MRILGLASVVRGRYMTLAFVLIVLGYKVTTLDAPGFTLQFIFEVHKVFYSSNILGFRH